MSAIYFAARLNGSRLGGASGGFFLEENISGPTGGGARRSGNFVIGWVRPSSEEIRARPSGLSKVGAPGGTREHKMVEDGGR